jgi:hypothetical protein
MRCYVYRSSRQQEAYLYLSSPTILERLPESLRRSFGRPELVLELVLTPQRQLARESAGQVLESLLARGFHLQLPPQPQVGPLPKPLP